MSHSRTLALTILILLTCSMTVIASERFAIAAKSGTNLFLKIIKLEQNRIKLEDVTVIDTRHYIVNTAVIPRKLSDSDFALDVYFATCLDPSDIFCDNPTVSLIRLNSELQARFRKDFAIPAFSLSAERFEDTHGVSRRLFLNNCGKVSERKTRKDGNPYKDALDVGTRGDHFIAVAAEDGKMAASISADNEIEIWSLRSNGPLGVKHVDDPIFSLALSGTVTPSTETGLAGSIPNAFRFLFFRVFRDGKNRLMRQKIDESLKFVGEPKAFTKFTSRGSIDFVRSVAITPNANMVVYTDYDPTCKRDALKAQVFDPQSEKRIGSSKLLIRCQSVPKNSGEGIRGIAISQLDSERPALSPFAGNWNITFSGDCPAKGQLKIGTFGGLAGEIGSPCEVYGGLHYFSGSVSSSGEILNGTITEGRDFLVGSLTGSFKGNFVSGTYQYLYGNASGRWSATKE